MNLVEYLVVADLPNKTFSYNKKKKELEFRVVLLNTVVLYYLRPPMLWAQIIDPKTLGSKQIKVGYCELDFNTLKIKNKLDKFESSQYQTFLDVIRLD